MTVVGHRKVTHSENIPVNMRAKGNPVKAVREGSKDPQVEGFRVFSPTGVNRLDYGLADWNLDSLLDSGL